MTDPAPYTLRMESPDGGPFLAVSAPTPAECLLEAAAEIKGKGGHELMTVEEVAAFFKVEEGTVHKWVQRGKITPAKTPGGAPRFSRSGIIRELNN